MTNDNNISNNAQPNKRDEKLLDYLNDALSNSEQHAFEKDMADDPFLQDAVEGLQGVQQKEHLQKVVQDLNKQLHENVKKRKARKEKRKFKNLPYLYVTIGFILLMLVVVVLVILKFLN